MRGHIAPKTAQGQEARGNAPASYIAIVDDDESVRRALARLLSTWSLSVRAYSSGPEFLETLKAGTPDCLILDLQMPDMTGLEVLHYLAGAGFRFPVLIATAQDELGIRSRCELAGAMGFLSKPFQIEPLLEALAAALGSLVEDAAASQSDALIEARLRGL